MDLSAINAWWASDPAAHEFIGGQAPYVGRRLPPPAFVLIADIVPSIELERPWDNWWIPADPLPELGVKTPQGPPLVFPAGGTQSLPGVYASFPADATDITWLQLDPELISPPTPPPPPPLRIRLAQAQRPWDLWWIPPQEPPDPLPQLQTRRQLRFIAPPVLHSAARFYSALGGQAPSVTALYSATLVSPQPFVQGGHPRLEAIEAAWVTVDSLPQLPRRLPPQFLAPRVPHKAPVDVTAAWVPDAPVAQRRPAVVQGTFPNTVLSRIVAGIAVAAWAPEPVVPQPRALIITPPAVSKHPPLGSRESVLVAWVPEPPAPQILPPRLVQGPTVPEPVLARIYAGIAVSAWTPQDTLPELPPPSVAAVVLGWRPALNGAQVAIVNMWQEVPPHIFLPETLFIEAIAVIVDNPPLIGTSVDNLAEIIGFWAPSLFDAWFTASPIVTPGPLAPSRERHGRLIQEALRSPHELGSTLRAGIGALSRS